MFNKYVNNNYSTITKIYYIVKNLNENRDYQ